MSPHEQAAREYQQVSTSEVEKLRAENERLRKALQWIVAIERPHFSNFLALKLWKKARDALKDTKGR